MKKLSLYPILFFIFMAIPEANINLKVINLRIEDLIIYIFLCLNIGAITYTLRLLISPNYIVFTILLLYALVSLILTGMFYSERVSLYYLMKTLGSIPYLMVIPFWLSEERYRNSLLVGVVLASYVFFTQVLMNLSEINILQMRDSAQLKSNVAFSSLNPNSIGTYSIIFLMYIVVISEFIKVTSQKQNNVSGFNILTVISLFLMCVLPFLVFTRGAIGALVVFFLLTFLFMIKFKNKTKALFFVFICVNLIFIKYGDIILPLISSAFTIDLSTGEGLSSRDIVWSQALTLIRDKPMFGHGFTSELIIFKNNYGGGMSHNIFFRYFIELGMFGLFIFVFAYCLFSINKLNSAISRTPFRRLYMLQLFLMISFFASDLFGQIQYLDKLHFLILFITTFQFKANVTSMPIGMNGK